MEDLLSEEYSCCHLLYLSLIHLRLTVEQWDNG